MEQRWLNRAVLSSLSVLLVVLICVPSHVSGAAASRALPSYLRPSEDVLPTPESTPTASASAAVEEVVGFGGTNDPVPEPRNANPEPKEVKQEAKKEADEATTGAAKQLEEDLKDDAAKAAKEAKEAAEKEKAEAEVAAAKAAAAEKEAKKAAEAKEIEDKTGRGSASPDQVEYDSDPKNSEPPAEVKNILDKNSILVQKAKANAGAEGLNPSAEAEKKVLDDTVLDEKVSGEVSPTYLAEPVNKEAKQNADSASAASGASSVTKSQSGASDAEYAGPQGDASEQKEDASGQEEEYGGLMSKDKIPAVQKIEQMVKEQKGGDSDIKPTQSIQNVTEPLASVPDAKGEAASKAPEPSKEEKEFLARKKRERAQKEAERKRREAAQNDNEEKGSCSPGKGAIDIITSELNCTTNKFEMRGKSYRMSFHYQRRDGVKLVHTGNSLQVSSDNLGYMESGCCEKEKFSVSKLSFFSPSMHQIDDKQYPMELQIEHRGQTGTVTLVVLFDVQRTSGGNKFLGQLEWGQLPSQGGNSNVVNGCVDFELLEQALSGSYYAYESSACGQSNSWRVMKTPIGMSSEQLVTLRSVFPEQGKRESEARAGRQVVLFERKSL